MLVRALVDAYRSGYFPMADPRFGAIQWFSPDPRAIVPLDPGGVHLARSLVQRVRSGRFRITTDQDFSSVIRACARPRPSAPETWIDERIIDAYEALHEAGHAHSVEAWLPVPVSTALAEQRQQRQEASDRAVPPRRRARSSATARKVNTPRGPMQDRHPWPVLREEPMSPDRSNTDPGEDSEGGPWVLVGGLYGVHIGSVFFGESMFSAPELGGTDASKVCFVHLLAHLRRRGFTMLDSQFANDHMERFGLIEIDREEYLESLARATTAELPWLPWQAYRDDADGPRK
jgi:Leu/Phe-tRNA-protein transferase